MSDVEMLGMGVLLSQRKAPPQRRREWRKVGDLGPWALWTETDGHTTWQGPTQSPRIHTVICTALFDPPSSVPQVLALETQVLPTMAWYSLFTVSLSAITQDNLTLLLLKQQQNLSTCLQGQKELSGTLIQKTAFRQSPHFYILISSLLSGFSKSFVFAFATG